MVRAGILIGGFVFPFLEFSNMEQKRAQYCARGWIHDANAFAH